MAQFLNLMFEGGCTTNVPHAAGRRHEFSRPPPMRMQGDAGLDRDPSGFCAALRTEELVR